MSEWQETIIGRIPAHWQLKKLSDCGFHIGDGNYSSKYPRQSELLEEGIPFISANNLSNGRITRDGLRFISSEQHGKLQKGHISAKDILIVVRGDVGQVAIVSDEYEDANINAQLAFLRSPESIESLFIYYLLSHFKKCGITDLHATGSVQPQITIRQLNDFDIILPPHAEQRAITAVLASLDDKIDLLHRQNKTLEALAQTLFRHWFIDGAEDDWEEIILGEVLSELEVGTRPKGGIGNISSGIPSIGAESIVRIGVFDFSKTKYIPQEFYEKMTRGKIQNRDVLVYKDGGTPGSFEPHISMAGDGFPFEICAINSHVYRVRTNGIISQCFLYFWFSSEPTLEEMRKRSTGIAIPGINKSAIQSLPLILPSSFMLNEFNSIVEPFVTKIFANCNQIRTLEMLRDTLLPKLMSGEVRVRL